MADLATQKVDVDGVEPVLGAANSGGDNFVPGESVYIEIDNADAAPHTATVVTPKEAFPGAAIEDIEIVVPAGTRRFAGPFPSNRFGDPANDGKAAITYDAVTNVTIGVFSL